MRTKLFFGLLISLIISSGDLSAQISLYGINVNSGSLQGFNNLTGNSTFYQIDYTTGNETYVGDVGFDRCTCMDQNPVDKKLYAVCNRTASPVKVLITIDTASGAGTEVGPLGSFFNTSSGIPGMSFRSDGALFGWTERGDEAIRINTSTGAAVLLGPSGISTLCTGMSFSASDVLYLFSECEINTINQGTGTASPVTSYPCCNITNADFHPITGQIYGYDAQYRAPSFNAGVSPGTNLNIVDPTSGNITNVGSSGLRIHAIAFVGFPPPIPTMDQWAMFLFGLIVFTIAIVGIYNVRRARAL